MNWAGELIPEVKPGELVGDIVREEGRRGERLRDLATARQED